MNARSDREEQLVLELLDVVGRRNDVSQRHLARHMGVALGLANSYLRRCIRKGFIKISEAPANRYFYYLTPKGFAEKGRLTAKYLAYSFRFYGKAGESCLRLFEQCRAQGWRRIVLCGCSDLAEIAALRAEEADIVVVGIYDPNGRSNRLAGKPVIRNLEQAAPYDVCVLTDLAAPAETLTGLRARIGRERILIPDILGIV